MNLNKMSIIGRVGRDPEWKQVGPGLCKFSVAVSDDYKKGDEWIRHTDWFDVSVWGDYGKRVMEKLSKGSLVYIEGKMSSNKVDDKVFWTLKAMQVIKLEKSDPRPAAVVVDDDDSLPF